MWGWPWLARGLHRSTGRGGCAGYTSSARSLSTNGCRAVAPCQKCSRGQLPTPCERNQQCTERDHPRVISDVGLLKIQSSTAQGKEAVNAGTQDARCHVTRSCCAAKAWHLQ